jgi:hypothetical protein
MIHKKLAMEIHNVVKAKLNHGKEKKDFLGKVPKGMSSPQTLIY